MNLLFIHELFCQISVNINDREKIFLTSCSKITYNLKSLIKLDLEYNLEEINDKCYIKNILMKEFTLENKIRELIENLIPESIIICPKYVKFISNNTNIKLFRNKEIIEKLVSYDCNYLAMKLMLNNNESIDNINKQFVRASEYGYLPIVKLFIEKGADIHAEDDMAIISASYMGHLSVVKSLIINRIGS